MEAIKGKYETLINDMATHSHIIDCINRCLGFYLSKNATKALISSALIEEADREDSG